MTVVLKKEAQNKILATNSLKCHDFEMSWEDTHRRKALCLQDVWRDILKFHVKIHTGEKPAGCAMRLLLIGPTRNVMRTCVQEKKPFACGMCNETFVNRTYQKCVAKIQTGEKPFSCMMCDKTFLNVMRTYTHEKTICICISPQLWQEN